MNVLSLFSGTQSWTKFYSKEDKIYNIDIEYLYSNTLCRNILYWDYKTEITDKIDIIYASPPCNLYFTILKNLNGNTKYTEQEKQLSIQLVDKTIEIIEYFRPKFFVIENPVGKMKQHYPKILDKAFIRLDYCMYGKKYKKPTNIWTNLSFTPKTCSHGRNHIEQFKDLPLGFVNDEQYRAMIPEELSLEIYNSIKKEMEMVICEK